MRAVRAVRAGQAGQVGKDANIYFASVVLPDAGCFESSLIKKKSHFLIVQRIAIPGNTCK